MIIGIMLLMEIVHSNLERGYPLVDLDAIVIVKVVIPSVQYHLLNLKKDMGESNATVYCTKFETLAKMGLLHMILPNYVDSASD